MIRRSLCLLAMLVLTTGGFSQMIKPFVLNSAGGFAMVGGNVYDWSFGEMAMIHTSSGGGLIVTAGLLQPIDPNVSTPELAKHVMQLDVFPNPASDHLILESSLPTESGLHYFLYDITGRQIHSNQVSVQAGVNFQTIPLQGYSVGDYLLKVIVQAVPPGISGMKTFKIQKIR